MNKVFVNGAIAKKDDFLYFSARYFNALLRTNINTNNTEYIRRFDKESGCEKLHSKAFTYGNYIWFIPHFGELIACFNTLNNEIEYFEIGEPFCYDGVMGDHILRDAKGREYPPKFVNAGYIDENRLFLVPADIQRMIIIDLEHREVIQREIDNNPREELLGVGACCGTKIWMAPYFGKDIYIVDYNSGESLRISKPKELGAFYGLSAWKNTIVISDNINRIFYYDANTYQMSEKKLNVDVLTNGKGVRDIKIIGDEVFLLPLDSELIIKYGIRSEKVEICSSRKNIEIGTLQLVSTDSVSLFFASYTYGFWGYVNENGMININSIEVDKDTYIQIIKDNYTKMELRKRMKNAITLEEEIPLSLYLECI